MKRILLAEDESLLALLFKNTIEDLGHKIIGIASSGKEAIEQTCALRPDVAFLDIKMESKTAGIEACRSIKINCPKVKVYFLTAYSEGTFANELTGVQYDGYIEKIDFEDIVEKLLI